jgi:hypothetical protein
MPRTIADLDTDILPLETYLTQADFCRLCRVSPRTAER